MKHIFLGNHLKLTQEKIPENTKKRRPHEQNVHRSTHSAAAKWHFRIYSCSPDLGQMFDGNAKKVSLYHTEIDTGSFEAYTRCKGVLYMSVQ